MQHRIVQYTADAASADDNQALIEEVFRALDHERPEGLNYTVLRDVGQRFIHIVAIDDPATNPLTALDAFKAFQRDFAKRVVSGPDVASFTEIGSYRSTLK